MLFICISTWRLDSFSPPCCPLIALSSQFSVLTAPGARYLHTAVCLGDVMYIPGGVAVANGSSVTLGDIWQLSLASGTWIKRPVSRASFLLYPLSELRKHQLIA